ncbi:OCIA domain-containing protein 1-like [Emys orbicularis]|uniref:OCIA domain-containing protein 1-like n=1 Tax=Emys orbicularis TaxID=82168 RepID=UPI0031FDC87D
MGLSDYEDVAGICGYIAGKISYMSACQEKFKRLENSPIGESIRQGRRPLPHEYAAQKSAFANLPSQSPFGSSPTAEAPLSSSYSHEYSSADQSVSNYAPIPFSSSLNESSPTGITERNAPEPVPLLEESPKRKSVSYEELRNRNRETYEVALTQKAETPVKSSQEDDTYSNPPILQLGVVSATQRDHLGYLLPPGPQG